MVKYSFEFKKMVVKEYIRGLGGYTYLSRKHDIKSRGQVHDWVKIYQEFGEEGIDGLSQKKGCPSNMPKKKKRGSETVKNQEVKELEKLIRLLEIENAYLKELQRRGLTDPEFLAKTKRESPTNSEKKDEN